MFSLDTYSSLVRNQIESYLDQQLAVDRFESTHLLEAMRYSLLGGGKRIRPLLVYSSHDCIRGMESAFSSLGVRQAASALECIHTYSLIHDDLPAMDDDDLRRGRPTCHKQFNEATAILAGDGLLNFAFEILLEGIEQIGAPMLKAARVIATAAGIRGMVTGQQLDLDAEQAVPTPQRVQAIHRNKTGALLRASVLAGACLAEADSEQLNLLSTFGEKMGLAFQIVDDLLDLEKTTEQLGKSAGKDQAQQKMTYPAAFGVEASRKMAADLTSQAELLLEPLGESATPLRATAALILHREY